MGVINRNSGSPIYNTLAEAVAANMSLGQLPIVLGTSTEFDGGGIIYSVQPNGSGGIAMANGNELVQYTGTAATKDTGTAPGQLPPAEDVVLQSQVGTAPSEIPLNSDLYVDSLVDLPAVVTGQQINAAGYHAGTTVGGGRFVGIASGRHNGGTLIDPDRSAEIGTAAYYVDSGVDVACWERVGYDALTPEMFGGGVDSLDNTDAYNALIAASDENGKVIFEAQGVYLGNFISASKSLRVDLNGATLTDTDITKNVIGIGDYDAVSYDVTEVTLSYRDTQFTVVGASTLFSVGDIGYLWDGAMQSGSGAVNYETIKIKDISGDVITVVGFLASYKGASDIKFYRSPSQIKNPVIRNGIIKPSAGHLAIGAALINVEGGGIENIEVREFPAKGVGVRYSYGFYIENIRPLNPTSTVSGDGYGCALISVTNFTVRNIHGESCRHVFDQDSAYFGTIENVSDMDDQSAPVGLAHTGFAGHITFRGLNCVTDQYPVVLSAQGYGGTPSADKSNHPFRNIIVEDVDAVIRTGNSPDDFGVYGVYFQNSILNCKVRNVTSYLKSALPVTTTGSSIVRVNGIVLGSCSITNVNTNKIGCAYYSSGDGDGLAYDGSVISIENIDIDHCYYVIFVQGKSSFSTDNVHLKNPPVSNILAIAQSTGVSDDPEACYIGSAVSEFTGVTLLSSTAPTMKGSIKRSSINSNTNISVSSGYALVQLEIQTRSLYLGLVSPVGGGTMTMSATDALPPPLVNGYEIKISTFSGRESIQFPAGNNIHAGFTIAPDSIATIVSTDGKWLFIGQHTK